MLAKGVLGSHWLLLLRNYTWKYFLQICPGETISNYFLSLKKKKKYMYLNIDWNLSLSVQLTSLY